MKKFAFCGIYGLAFLLIQVHTKATLDEHEIECIEKTGVNEELVYQAKDNFVVEAGDEKYKEFLSCYWIKLGFQRKTGEIVRTKIEAVLERSFSREHAKHLAKLCVDKEGATPGDTAVLVLECLDDNAPNIENFHDHYG